VSTSGRPSAGPSTLKRFDRLADKNECPSAGSTARLWRLADYTPFGPPLPGHDGDVNAVAFIQLHGRSMLVTGDDEGALRCWDVLSHEPVVPGGWLCIGTDSGLVTLTLHPQGR